MTSPAPTTTPPLAGGAGEDARALTPLTLRFRDPALELRYRSHFYDKNILNIRVALVAATVILVGFALIDWLVFPRYTRIFLTLRFGVALPLLLLAWIPAFARFCQPLTRRYLPEIVVAGVTPVIVTVLIMAWVGLGEGGSVHHVMFAGFVYVLFVTMTHTVLRVRFVHAAPFGLGLLVASMLIAAHRVPFPPGAFGALWFLGVCLNLQLMYAAYVLERFERLGFLKTLIIEQERAKSERLLMNILPEEIATRLKDRHESIADGFREATVLFADIVGFTPLAERLPPESVVRLLDDVFSRFDALTERHGLEKIKTIGDAYMVAAGIPTPRPDHAAAVADLALDMLESVKTVTHGSGQTLDIRIGINSGPVVAGVIGRKRFLYDLWGDTVNTASRMESHGLGGCIQVTEATRALLDDAYLLRERGEVEVKGKGTMRTWFLLGRRPAAGAAAAGE